MHWIFTWRIKFLIFHWGIILHLFFVFRLSLILIVAKFVVKNFLLNLIIIIFLVIFFIDNFIKLLFVFLLFLLFCIFIGLLGKIFLILRNFCITLFEIIFFEFLKSIVIYRIFVSKYTLLSFLISHLTSYLFFIFSFSMILRRHLFNLNIIVTLNLTELIFVYIYIIYKKTCLIKGAHIFNWRCSRTYLPKANVFTCTWRCSCTHFPKANVFTCTERGSYLQVI